jgi:hypothetical protein
MSLYSLYIEEREGKKIIENEKGFITYLEMDKSKSIFVCDFFIKKEFRGTEAFREFSGEVEKVAKEKGYNYAIATIDASTKNWQRSKTLLENYGFKPTGKDDLIVYFIKELNYGR